MTSFIEQSKKGNVTSIVGRMKITNDEIYFNNLRPYQQILDVDSYVTKLSKSSHCFFSHQGLERRKCGTSIYQSL